MHYERLIRLSALLLISPIILAITSVASADVLIFGGTRGVGLETVRQLRTNGEGVTVMVRSPGVELVRVHRDRDEEHRKGRKPDREHLEGATRRHSPRSSGEVEHDRHEEPPQADGQEGHERK